MDSITKDVWDEFHLVMIPALRGAITGANASVSDLGQVLERLPVAAAIQALDAAGSVVFVNESFVRSFGYTRDEVPTLHHWAERA